LTGKPAKRHHQEPVTENLAAVARGTDITDPRVLEAIRHILRAAFVSAAYVTRAYDDAPIPHQQVTIQPSLPTAIIAALGLTGAREVFGVGTGYGWRAAWPGPREVPAQGDQSP
jgi:protein-L-isoaspartate(D-aspartate) O-methyltransferase